jgi:hypothetical protein
MTIMRTHKVGTITLGLALIGFGVLFLIHLFGGVLSYRMIFDLWPVIFLSLGVEVLVSTLPGKAGERMQFDGGSIVLLFLLALFAMAMAGADTLITVFEEHGYAFFY